MAATTQVRLLVWTIAFFEAQSCFGLIGYHSALITSRKKHIPKVQRKNPKCKGKTPKCKGKTPKCKGKIVKVKKTVKAKETP